MAAASLSEADKLLGGFKVRGEGERRKEMGSARATRARRTQKRKRSTPRSLAPLIPPLSPTQAAIASKDYTTAKKTLVQIKVRGGGVCVEEEDRERRAAEKEARGFSLAPIARGAFRTPPQPTLFLFLLSSLHRSR
jgi:hypothetical protein